MCVFPLPCPTPLSPANAENSNRDQRQVCKKHELYVSFRDLGWQVRTGGRMGPDGGRSGVGVPVLPARQRGCVPCVQ